MVPRNSVLSCALCGHMCGAGHWHSTYWQYSSTGSSNLLVDMASKIASSFLFTYPQETRHISVRKLTTCVSRGQSRQCKSQRPSALKHETSFRVVQDGVISCITLYKLLHFFPMVVGFGQKRNMQLSKGLPKHCGRVRLR